MRSEALEIEQKVSSYIEQNFDAEVTKTEKMSYDYNALGDKTTEISLTVKVNHDVPEVNEGTQKYDVLEAFVLLGAESAVTVDELLDVVEHDRDPVTSRLSELQKDDLIERFSAGRYEITPAGVWSLVQR